MAEHLSADHTRQRVATRLALLNSALTFFALTHEKPAAVSVDEMLALAEHLEHWAWRDLGRGLSISAPPLTNPPPLETSTVPPPHHTIQTPPTPAVPPPANGNSHHVTKISTKQSSAIFAIAKSKGYSAEHIT